MATGYSSGAHRFSSCHRFRTGARSLRHSLDPGGFMRGRTILATGCAVLLTLAVPTAAAAADPSTDRHGGQDVQIGGFKHLVVIYEENHSFDNLYGTWGSVERPAGRRAGRRRPGAHHPGRAERRRLRLPAAERRQPARRRPRWPPPASTRRTASRRAPSPTSRSPSTTTSAPTDKTCPAPGRLRRQRRAQGQRRGAARRLHP